MLNVTWWTDFPCWMASLGYLSAAPAATPCGSGSTDRPWPPRTITVADVELALQNQNVELPAGRVESTRKEFTVRVTRLFNSQLKISERLVVRQGRDSHLIRLRDVALRGTGRRRRPHVFCVATVSRWWVLES